MNHHQIGPYSIVRLIKQGGQGRVYLGFDNRLQRKVAIKIDALPASLRARRRALSEARKAASINSPQVVQIYDLVESGGYLAIVMEYVPGTDLERLLTAERLSIASVLAIAAGLTVALAASRAQGIVHGDLKAGNVLVDTSGGVKLTDFGVARQKHDPGEPVAGGSLSALSPEHFTGAPLDVRSDLFALGALLYRMLSGEHPFLRNGRLDDRLLLDGEKLKSRLQHVNREPVPEELLSLVFDLLQPDPANRPQNTHPVRSVLRMLQRKLSLHELQSLQRQAIPHYRHESPDDIPLVIPESMRGKARSRLRHSAVSRLLRRLAGLSLSTRLALVASLIVCAGLLVALALHEQPVRVHFERPQMVFVDRAGVPGDVNDEWLMDTVYLAVEESLGPMHASGYVRPRVYYAELAARQPAFVINSGLRCSKVICVFSISRREGSAFDFRQVMIAPDLPVEVWKTLVREGSRALFP